MKLIKWIVTATSISLAGCQPYEQYYERLKPFHIEVRASAPFVADGVMKAMQADGWVLDRQGPNFMRFSGVEVMKVKGLNWRQLLGQGDLDGLPSVRETSAWVTMISKPTGTSVSLSYSGDYPADSGGIVYLGQLRAYCLQQNCS